MLRNILSNLMASHNDIPDLHLVGSIERKTFCSEVGQFLNQQRELKLALPFNHLIGAEESGR